MEPTSADRQTNYLVMIGGKAQEVCSESNSQGEKTDMVKIGMLHKCIICSAAFFSNSSLLTASQSN
jgi:hypothetical protein